MHAIKKKNHFFRRMIYSVFVFSITNQFKLNQDQTNGYTNGDSYINQSGTVVYGAASKGIIKRDQQNNAVVYKTYYAAANPFQQMDPVELEKYKKEVAQRQIKDQGTLKFSILDFFC